MTHHDTTPDKRIPWQIRLESWTRRGFRWLGILIIAVLSLRIVAGLVAERVLHKAETRAWETGLFQTPAPVTDDVRLNRALQARAFRRFAAAIVLTKDEPFDLTADQRQGLDAATPLTDEEHRQARATLANLETAMTLAQEGAALPYHYDGNAFPAPDFDEELDPSFIAIRIKYRTGRTLGEALRLLSLCREREGDPDGALTAATAALRLADGLRCDGVLISEMVAQAVTRRGADTVAALLERTSPSPRICRQALEALRDVDPTNTFADSIRGEAAGARKLFERLGNFKGSTDVFGGLFFASPGLLERSLAWLIDPYLKLDQSAYFDILGGLAAAVPTDAATDAQWRAAQTMQSPEIPWYFILTSIATPNIRIALQRSVETRTRFDRTRILLAAHVMAGETGAFPSSLEAIDAALVPLACRVDPLTGTARAYRVDGGHPVVDAVAFPDRRP